MKSSFRPKSIGLIVGVLALFISGCATTRPTAQFSKPLPAASHVSAKDTVNVGVEAAAGIDILAVDKDRIAQRVQERIAAKQVANPAHPESKTFDIEIRLTQYEKGSAFARFMLAGLGQIHIAGTVTVLTLPEKTPVATFTLSKTFAWGGAYGGTTSIEDIEKTFADGIAAAVTGQAEDPPQPKPKSS